MREIKRNQFIIRKADGEEIVMYEEHRPRHDIWWEEFPEGDHEIPLRDGCYADTWRATFFLRDGEKALIRTTLL